jgi:hypothetical protein
MAFVNEYITEEDKEKYGLDTLWASYHNVLSQKLPNKKDWTIDRERKIWLMQTALIPDDSIFDHAYSSEQIWTLYYQGQSVEVRIEVSDNKEIADQSYNKVWDLLSLSPNALESLSTDVLINFIEEALKVHGYLGIIRQRPNFTVALRDCRSDR